MDKTTGSLSYLEEFKVDALGSVLERKRHGPYELPYQSTYMGEKLTDIVAVRNSFADGLVANDTYNHFVPATGDVHASGTITEVSQNGVYHESARMASHSYFSGDGKLIAHQRYASETGTGERWGVWEEYRYDALGRRVMVGTARPDTLCNVVNCYGSISAASGMGMRSCSRCVRPAGRPTTWSRPSPACRASAVSRTSMRRHRSTLTASWTIYAESGIFQYGAAAAQAAGLDRIQPQGSPDASAQGAA